MKKDGSYRYNLKFSCDEKKNVRAGELLEKLGNKKSVIVVEALNEYLDRHPDLEQENCEIRIIEESKKNVLPENWKDIVIKMIEERVGVVQEPQFREAEVESEGAQDAGTQEVSNDDVSQMLNNLETFFL